MSCGFSLVDADIGAALGVYAHTSSGMEGDALPVQERTEMYVEDVVGVSTRSKTCQCTDNWACTCRFDHVTCSQAATASIAYT